MASVYLDAMIPRADFSEAHANDSPISKITNLSLQQLAPGSFLVPTLRKPDFQRETNQWEGRQVVTFLKSFLDNELVPSVIFWPSPGKTFVIDGAHRLSALLAWINDDYGDGHLSKPFFGASIKNEQVKAAESLRKVINREIGSFTSFQNFMQGKVPIPSDQKTSTRVNNARVRSLDLQWVEGDATVAETSFFKINQQGTPLDETEERLLRNRRAPIAIIARSVVRAGTGHKYWSFFDPGKVSQLETLAKELHELLFDPEVQRPIKTLNLPHGGRVSPISAYNVLMDLSALIVLGAPKEDSKSVLYIADESGDASIRAVQDVLKVMKRITGNSIESLGLHPAVYFYSGTGRHIDVFFLAVASVFAKAIRNNDKEFFKTFTKNRKLVESIFLDHKSLLGQANIAIGSKTRVSRWTQFFDDLCRGKLFKDGVSQEKILVALELSGKVVASKIEASSVTITDDTKSTVFLRESIEAAMKCPNCGGLIHVEKAISFDHQVPKSKGGSGSEHNVQLMHPYCNSLKGDSVEV
jgi:Protein of unknown function DUF262/HNH endonuclease